MRFCAIGADGNTIIGTYPGFISGGRNSAAQQFYTSDFNYKLTSVPGRQLDNSPTAQSLKR